MAMQEQAGLYEKAAYFFASSYQPDPTNSAEPANYLGYMWLITI